MEIKFENYETQGSIKIKDEEIHVNVDPDTKLYKEITLALEKGMTDLQDFRNDGIPGSVGFFEREGYDLPVAWIHDTQTKIYIDIYEKSDQKIVIVQHNYSIDVDALF